MTKEGVCPKESKQKDHSPRTTGKYARRRQKFYIYSWTPSKWCLRTRAHLIEVSIGSGGGGGEGELRECQSVLGIHSIFRFFCSVIHCVHKRPHNSYGGWTSR